MTCHLTLLLLIIGYKQESVYLHEAINTQMCGYTRTHYISFTIFSYMYEDTVL